MSHPYIPAEWKSPTPGLPAAGWIYPATAPWHQGPVVPHLIPQCMVTAVTLGGMAAVFGDTFIPGVLLFFGASRFVTPLFVPLPLHRMVALNKFLNADHFAGPGDLKSI